MRSLRWNVAMAKYDMKFGERSFPNQKLRTTLPSPYPFIAQALGFSLQVEEEEGVA